MADNTQAWFFQNGDYVTFSEGTSLFQMSLSGFLSLEPEYKVATTHFYNPGLRHYHRPINTHRDIQLPVQWEDGDRYLKRIPDFRRIAENEAFFEESRRLAVIAERRKAMDPAVARRKEYPFPEELIIAMWKHLIDGESLEESGVQKIQDARTKVKNKYPSTKTETPKKKKTK